MRYFRLKAASLVEVLVVLAIVSIAITAVATVNVRTQLTIRDNETIDIANNLLYEAIELAKSPTPVKTGNSTTNPSGYYAFDSQSVSLQTRPSSDPQLSATYNCNSTSPYRIIVSRVQGSPTEICLQLSIVQRTRELSTNTYYEVTARVVYSISNTKIFNQLVGYRRGGFN